jgi:phosphate transport system substrate-binding protein
MVAPFVRTSFRAIGALALIAALPFGAGCGGNLEGRAVVVGSATVLPYASAVAGDFAAANPLVDVSLRMDGTASGFTVFCDGTAPIVAASRAISDAEALACRATGVKYAQLAVARDALVVFTSPQNTQVTCLSLQDLYALTSTEGASGKTWKSASAVARALGSQTTLPSVDIKVVTPDTMSGSRQLFVEKVIEPSAQIRKKEADLRADHRDVSREQELLAATEIKGVLAFAGYATVAPWGDKVRRISIRVGTECVAPTPSNIASGHYPLSRPLFFYANVRDAKNSEAVNALVAALIDEGAMASGGDGVVIPLSSQAIAATQQTWESALSGDQGVSP